MFVSVVEEVKRGGSGYYYANSRNICNLSALNAMWSWLMYSSLCY